MEKANGLFLIRAGKSRQAVVCFLAVASLLITANSYAADGDERTIITVLDFQLSNVSEQEGAVIVDFLMSYIGETNAYRVIDRKERTAILEEIEFATSDCAEEACQIRIGQLLSANQIIVGSLGSVADRYLINLKLIDVQTGETLRTASEKYKSMGTLIDDSRRLIINFVSKGQAEEGQRLLVVPKTPDELKAVPQEELEIRKTRMVYLLDHREYRKTKPLAEMQDLATYYFDFEKSVLYKQYHEKGAFFMAVLNGGFGLGSWIQGDVGSGLVVTGLMLLGAIAFGSEEEGLGGLCLTVGVLTGWIMPFVFQADNNKQLRKALLWGY